MNTPATYIQKAALAALILCLPAHAMVRQAEQKLAQPASTLARQAMQQCSRRFISNPAVAQNVCRLVGVGAFAQARNLSLAREKQEGTSWWSSFRSLFGVPEELQKERAATKHYAEQLFKQTSEFNKISDDFSKTLLENLKIQRGEYTDTKAFKERINSDIVHLNSDKPVNFNFATALINLTNNINTLTSNVKEESSLLKALAEATQKYIQRRIPLIPYRKVDTTLPLDRQLPERVRELERLVAEKILVKDVMPAIHKEALKNLQLILDRETLTEEQAYWQEYEKSIKKLKNDFTEAETALESKQKEVLERWKKASPEERQKIETLRFNYVGPLDFAQQKWQLEQQKKRTVTP